MQTWTRRSQEREGTHLFSGAFFVTQGVMANLSIGEILGIYLDVQAFVKETGGIDYLQVYENDSGERLYLIDQCDPELTVEESFMDEYNYCTLLFSHEY